MKEESYTNRNEDTLWIKGKKNMDTVYMSEYSMENITSDDKEDLKVSRTNIEQK